MADEAVKFGLTQDFELKSRENKIYGVSAATVLNNVDCTGEARVQLQLPWLPGYVPWARVALVDRGTFVIPQVGDEVLVAFNHGDVRDPYIVGSCLNTIDRPSSPLPTDAVTKRKIRTPLGHELEFDEESQTVTLASNTMSKITLDPTKAEVSTPAAKITIGKAGDITISAKTKLTLEAPVVEIKAKSVLTAQSSGIAQFKADGACSLQGSLVKIN